MAEKSQFENINKKLLFKLLIQLVESGFDLNEPYEDYDKKEGVIQKHFKKYGFPVITYLDVEFFCKLKEINQDLLRRYFTSKDNEIYEFLIIPTSSDYTIDYSVRSSGSWVDYYYQNFDSYDSGWVEHHFKHFLDSNGFTLWDGILVDREYDYEDLEGYDINEIKKVDDEKLKETFTIVKKMVENLDAETLTDLKEIIENRLRII